MTTDRPEFIDVPFDGLDPERLIPTLPGLGLSMQPRGDGGRVQGRFSEEVPTDDASTSTEL